MVGCELLRMGDVREVTAGSPGCRAVNGEGGLTRFIYS